MIKRCWLPLFQLLIICYFSSCQEETKVTIENTIDCVEEEIQQLVITPPSLEMLEEEALAQQSSNLFDALLCNEMSTAQVYATKYGLGTLLYLNIDAIRNYEIVDCQITDPSAWVMVQINEEDKLVPFFFRKNKKTAQWQFQNIDIQRYSNLNYKQVFYRNKLPMLD